MLTNDKPPIFKSWNGWYVTVILVLILQILIFLMFTNHFS
jgi:hypothetical protein